MIKDYLRKIAFLFLRLLICITIATGLMTVVYMIPTNNIEKNIRKSAYIFEEEGTFPVLSRKVMSQYDNFTDSLILLEASNKSEDNAFIEALNVNTETIGNLNPTKTLVKHYIDKTPYDGKCAYARYWHGYLVFIKPLMSFVDYKGFRIINSFFVMLIMLINVCLMIKQKEKGFMVPYVISMLFLMPITIAINIQFSNCFYIMNIGILSILLMKNKNPNKIAYVFLYLGILTAFFDFLTYPVATFGVPCALYFFIIGKKRLQEITMNFIKVGLLWCIGYAVMWSSKWILATAITGKNVLEDGLKQTSTRTSGGMTIIERIKTIVATEIQNMYCFAKTPIIIIAAIYIVIMIILIIRQRKKIKNSFALIVPFVLLAFVPLCWYAIATEHSQVHCWYTHKALVVSAISILCIPAYLYTQKEQKT